MTSLIIQLVRFVFLALELAIMARVVLSWFPQSNNNSIIKIIYQITEPILGPIRSLIEKSAMSRNMMIDFSPIIAFILIGIIQNIILKLLV